MILLVGIIWLLCAIMAMLVTAINDGYVRLGEAILFLLVGPVGLIGAIIVAGDKVVLWRSKK